MSLSLSLSRADSLCLSLSVCVCLCPSLPVSVCLCLSVCLSVCKNCLPACPMLHMPYRFDLCKVIMESSETSVPEAKLVPNRNYGDPVKGCRGTAGLYIHLEFTKQPYLYECCCRASLECTKSTVLQHCRGNLCVRVGCSTRVLNLAAFLA